MRARALCRPGLSPHVRGSRRPRDDRRGRTGVYPRMCGGASPLPRLILQVMGLSPHVRGSLRARLRAQSVGGSIPACAGEPKRPPRLTDTLKVYPRMCGGARRRMDRFRQVTGLSPHVRGSLALLRDRRAPQGSIPACAGEPPVSTRSAWPVRVYPRMCGGAMSATSASLRFRGLSPHVRGSQLDELITRRLCGSIPACAGEPGAWMPLMRSHRVYPRMCGGASSGWHIVSHRWGLSPHVRGSPVRRVPFARKTGSIPACAGEPNDSR